MFIGNPLAFLLLGVSVVAVLAASIIPGVSEARGGFVLGIVWLGGDLLLRWHRRSDEEDDAEETGRSSRLGLLDKRRGAWIAYFLPGWGLGVLALLLAAFG